jgi:NADH:ubiquinone oxidoreductase subunit
MNIDRRLTIRTLKELLLDSYTGCRFDDTFDSIEVFGDVEKPSLDEFRTKYNELRERIIPFEELRTKRNKRLTECDWVVIRATSTDTPIPEEWKTYMQALRDLPSTTEDPTNPVWPVQPTA